MLNRRFFLFVILSGFSFYYASGQSGDFCKAVTTIVNDAPNSFRNIRGKAINGGMWECGIKVPGTIASRFVNSMGLFYEGAFFQGRTPDELKTAYEKYKGILKDCLLGHGYVLSETENFYPGLAAYKKLIFMLEEKDDPAIIKPLNPPAHVSMEVTYSKEVGKYTLVMYIFEH